MVLILGGGLYLGGPFLLTFAGRALIAQGPLVKADMALVLSGQPYLRVPEAARMEAPPSRPPLFGGKGTDSATMETAIVRREADGCAGAGRQGRQQTRREMRGERAPLTKA